MKFTVVMASTLEPYQGAAERRDEKIIRAVGSVMSQTFPDWELRVVADGCQKTVDVLAGITDPRVLVTLIPKAPWWDGAPRNRGIDDAQGEYIVYLDNDDCYGEDHLKIIASQLKSYDWVYYDDWTYLTKRWAPRFCNIKKIGMNGTSNVCHKKSLGVRWVHRGYAHDHHFNQQLLRFRNNTKISIPQYYCCHMPGYYDL